MDTNKINIDILTPDQRRMLLVNVSSMTPLGLGQYTWTRASVLSREIESRLRAIRNQDTADEWRSVVTNA